MANYAMTRPQREAFLADTHVAMLAIDNERGRAPFLVPVWYWYRPGGDVHIVTGGASRKMPLLRKAGRASLCVQTETMPYMYDGRLHDLRVVAGTGGHHRRRRYRTGHDSAARATPPI